MMMSDQKSLEMETVKLIDIEPEAKSEIELFKHWQDVLKESSKAVSRHDNEARSKVVGSPRSDLNQSNLFFARMYNDLIHSGKYTEKLMKMEYSYKPNVDDMFKTRDISLEELQLKSAREIETAISQLGKSHTEATISCLSSIHCQDMERLLNNWNMSIEALKDAQREDFCDRLKELYREWTKESADNSKENSLEQSTQYFEPSDESKDEVSFEDLTLEASDVIQMEESFTINLGSQLKTAHNLRILAVNSLYFCDTHLNRSYQMRTQTAMSLYSNNLSALVLLVDNHFECYYGIQHDFAQLCNRLNEFHFDSFNKQTKHIQERVMPVHAGRKNLEMGDCYVTRHSNLASVHVVFHLVTDDSLKTSEVNSRHQIMSSLRNILKVAHMYDIKTISIPLLLVDEMDEEILTVAWCLKRAEIVLKCVKGFLIEMASLSTGVEQGTIQFLVPKGISEELFASLAAFIPEVFRLANSVNLRTTP